MKIEKLLLGLSLCCALATVGVVAASSSSNLKADATTFTPTTTEVTGLSHAVTGTGRQRLMASLSVADWGSSAIEHDTSNFPGSGARCGEYSYHSNVLINGVTMTEWSGWNERCIFVAGGAKVPKLYFDISHANFVANDVVTFKEGTEFPSYNYVISNSGTNSYKLASEISFKYNGSTWSVVVPFDEVSTEVVSVKFSTGSAPNHYCYMSIALSQYDYSGGETEDSTWTEMTNFNIGGIKLNGSAISFDSARKNRFRVKNSTVILYVYSADGTGSEYTSVFIPAKTDFPSKAYHDSGTKTKYVVDKDTTLYPSSVGFIQGTSADLIKITRVNSTRLRLAVSLTNFDHAAYTGDSSIDNYPTTYTIFDNVTIDGSTMQRWTGMPDYRAYKFTGVAGWGFDFTFTADAKPSTVVVKTGCLFAATSYVDGGIERYYILTEDVTFKHCNSEYFDYACINTLDSFSNDYLKMNTIPTSEVGTGKCVSEGWYAAAKTKYTSLYEKDQKYFNEDEAYSDARARLSAWAAANGETFSDGQFSSSSNMFSSLINENNNIVIVVVVSIISITSLIGFIYIKRRKSC